MTADKILRAAIEFRWRFLLLSSTNVIARPEVRRAMTGLRLDEIGLGCVHKNGVSPEAREDEWMLDGC